MSIDMSEDATLNFSVIAYRGAPVASHAGWVADAKARGGFITQVPGGFFAGFDAARFGTATPFVYELQPIWLLIWEGVDVASDEFNRFVNAQAIQVAAANQVQDVQDLLSTAKNTATGAVAALPTIIAALAGVLVVILLAQLLALVPRRAT